MCLLHRFLSFVRPSTVPAIFIHQLCGAVYGTSKYHIIQVLHYSSVCSGTESPVVVTECVLLRRLNEPLSCQIFNQGPCAAAGAGCFRSRPEDPCGTQSPNGDNFEDPDFLVMCLLCWLGVPSYSHSSSPSYQKKKVTLRRLGGMFVQLSTRNRDDLATRGKDFTLCGGGGEHLPSFNQNQVTRSSPGRKNKKKK